MKKYLSMFLLLLLICGRSQQVLSKQKYDVAAYLYPAYVSDDPRLRPFWPMGMGEWETVMTMQKRNPGHYWDRRPLWGPINEADPAVMEMEIEQATRHGINVFIFDWYWFDGRPFMETTLTNGFLKAQNREKMKFYLMWANHDVVNTWDTRISRLPENNVIWQGSVDRQEFEKICRRNIELFFSQPEYYKIDGKPVFMIYDVVNFIKGLGGIKEAADAVKWFKQEVKKAGFPGLDLQFTMWKPNLNYSGFDAGKSDKPGNEFVTRLGFTSTSHYQFCHFTNVNDEYNNIMERVRKEWNQIDADFTIPYYPHISIGWDNSPRITQSAIVRDNTPENFAKALRDARDYADRHPNQVPLITINSWNEWTETSYLQPDNVYGYGYQEAVKKVFVDGE
ncbi:MAG: glycoside hydrolase family 99-like domain-containing protein [Bacteroidaceae bacterium]|nr:glycoside hydrolase family 99-like domain-containing protein [Bacteroidaceae bacterium]